MMLRFDVKATNDTVGPEGLVTSLIFFGCIPRLPGDPELNLPNKEWRIGALAVSRKENGEHCCQPSRGTWNSFSDTPSSKHFCQCCPASTHFSREKKKYMRHYTVFMCNKKTVVVEGENSSQQHFNIVNVRPYIEYDPVILPSDVDVILEQHSSDSIMEVYITEVFQHGNILLKSQEVIEARRKDIRVLLSKNSFRVV